MLYEIMKKFKFLVGLVAAVMFSLTYTSCEELENLVDDSEENVSGDVAFFPKAYADKEIAAWYSWTEKDKDKTKTEAVFLFKDNTFVVTKNKVYSKEDGRNPEREIEAVGQYSLIEGDYTNGKAQVVIADGGTMTVVIKDGKLTTEMGDEVFIKQDNAKLPKATDPTGNNNQGGGNNQNNGLEAFLPTAYANKTISGWYSYGGTMSDSGYDIKFVAAIYFFDDYTYVATSNMLLSGPNGEYPQRAIITSGAYKILEGNLTTGKIELTINASTSMTVEIENGQLKAIEQGETVIYTKQDNSKLPQPSEPTENGNQGGGNQDDQGPAFFPNTYDISTVVAWYSYTESEPMETRVETVFLLEGGTVLVTEHKIFEQSTQMPDERYIFVVGSYKLSGDYDNGTADVTIIDGYLEKGSKKNITITNGNLVFEYNNNFVYTRRELKDLPEPLEPDNQGGGNQGGDGDITGNSIYGTWVDDLANPYGTLTLNSNGTGLMWDESFNFTYEDGFLVYDQESKFQITIEGDVMTWAYIDESTGDVFPTGDVWYRANGSFDKKVSSGRWNGLMGEDESDCGIVYFFYENEVEIYIIAWGEQLKGSYTHEGGVISFNLREGYNARIGDTESWSWEAGNLDPETLSLTEGYEWWQMDSEVLSERKQELEKFTFALVSDVKAYGGLFGRNMTIVKAKTK